MRIQHKLFLVMVAVTIIPLIIFGSLSLNQSSKIIKTRVLVQLQKLGVDQSKIIKEYFLNLDEEIKWFETNDNFQLYIRYFDSGKDISFLKSLLESSFSYRMKNIEELQAIRFYSSDKQVKFELGKLEFFPRDIKEEYLLTNSVFLFRTEDGFLRMNVVKPIFLEGFETTRGYLVLGLNSTRFLNLFDNWTLGENEEAIGFILDTKNRFFAHTKDSKILESSKSIDFEKNTFTDRDIKDKFIYLKFVLSETPYLTKDSYLYAAVSLNKFMQPVNLLRKMVIWVGIASLLVALFLSYLMAKTIIQPVESLVEGARIVARGDLNYQIPLQRTDELGELTDTFNEMIRNLKEAYRKLENQIELVNADLARTNEELKISNEELQKKQRQIEEELDFARQVQEGLLPDVPEKLVGIDLASKMIPAKAVGGDFFAYDFDPDFPQRISIGIGDVSGKGVPAALLMVAVRDQFQSITKSEKAPGRVLSLLNKSIHQDIGAELFVTFLNAEIDVKNMVLLVSSGGHHPALVYRNKTGEIEEVSSGGIILGMFADIKYQEKVVEINKGDVILLYTDGVVEAVSPVKEMFGIDKLKGLFKTYANDSAGNICYNLYQKILDFVESTPQFDDITIIVAKIGGTDQ
ncbi:MAG: SpoIIE family protein phosphatase [Candidatus Hydrogenedentota bacterium]